MYQNGKIYKIVSDLTDMIYIGSTVQPLYKRHHQHTKDFKKSGNKCKSVELIKLGETRIELIEDFPCERREQLNAREGYYIKLYKDICVNKCIAGRTSKEYHKDNKEHMVEKVKQWRDINKDQIAEKAKQYKQDNKEKLKQYYEANKIEIAEKNKQYRLLHNKQIVEQKKQWYEANKEQICERKKQLRAMKKASKLQQ